MITSAGPIIKLVLIHFLLENERIDKRHVIGILISFLGIFFLLASRDTEAQNPANGSNFWGDLCMIGSVILHNCMLIFEKKALISGANPKQLIISVNVASVPVFFILTMVNGIRFLEVPTTSNGLLSYLYLITVAGVFFFYYRRWLTDKLGVLYVNSFSHLGKAFALFYAVYFLQETVR